MPRSNCFHRTSTIIASSIMLTFLGSPAAAQQTFPLYSNVLPSPPGMRERIDDKGTGKAIVRNVSQPTLTAFLPPVGKETGAAVIVAPGGGFMMLSIESEGETVAKRLAEKGIAAFVLKYRIEQTPDDRQEATKFITAKIMGFLKDRSASVGEAKPPTFAAAPLALDDSAQAIQLVRARATEWRIDPKRIGFLGFSAGGIAAAGVATGKAEGRPDFVGIIYGSLVGPVPKDAPPAFIATSADDPIQGPATSAIPLFNAWKAAGRSAELHVYERGGHGYGALEQGASSDHWFDQFIWWMESQKIL